MSNYNGFGSAIAKNDMDTVTIKGMLVDPSYTFNSDHRYLSDVVASRASGSTDFTVSNFAISVDDTDNRTEFDIDNYTSGTITLISGTNAVIFYIDTTVEATSELLTYHEIQVSGTQTTVFPIAGTITLTMDAQGIFSV